MPSAIQHYLARRPAGPPTFKGADSTAAAAALREKVVSLEHRYRLGGRSLFPPWLDHLNCSPWVLRRNLRAMLADGIVKAAFLGKTYAVASLDPQMTPAEETPAGETVSDFCLYAYTTAIKGGIPKMVWTLLAHKWLLGEIVAEMVWHKELWGRGRWRGKRFLKDIKARADAEAKYDEFGNLVAVVGRDADGESHEWTEGNGLEDFIVLKHMPLFEGAGMSDLLAAYQLVWERHVIERLRDIFLDKFVGPFVVAKYGQDGAPTQVTNQKTGQIEYVEDVIEPTVAGAKARGYAILPPGVTMEVLQLATSSQAEFQAAMDKKDEKIIISISGASLQMLTTNGIGTDVRGNSETQRLSSELFVWAGMVEFCAEINDRATPRIVRENYGDGVDYPTLTLGGINTTEAKSTADLYAVVALANGRPSRKALLKATGVQGATTPDDELLPPTVTPLPPGTPGTVSTPAAPGLAATAGGDATDAAAASGDVQGTALNGTQTDSLKELVKDLATRQLPPDTVRELIFIALPLADPVRVERLIRSLVGFRPAPVVTQTFADGGTGVKKKPLPLRVPLRSRPGSTPPADDQART